MKKCIALKDEIYVHLCENVNAKTHFKLRENVCGLPIPLMVEFVDI